MSLLSFWGGRTKQFCLPMLLKIPSENWHVLIQKQKCQMFFFQASYLDAPPYLKWRRKGPFCVGCHCFCWMTECECSHFLLNGIRLTCKWEKRDQFLQLCLSHAVAQISSRCVMISRQRTVVAHLVRSPIPVKGIWIPGAWVNLEHLLPVYRRYERNSYQNLKIYAYIFMCI